MLWEMMVFKRSFENFATIAYISLGIPTIGGDFDEATHVLKYVPASPLVVFSAEIDYADYSCAESFSSTVLCGSSLAIKSALRSIGFINMLESKVPEYIPDIFDLTSKYSPYNQD
jgi:hypothetical protein